MSRNSTCVSRRGFALVIVVSLLALMSAATVSLAFVVGVHGTQAVWVAADFDHELAVDSFVEMLPQLLAAYPSTNSQRVGNEDQQVLRLRVGACEIHGLVQRGRPMLRDFSEKNGTETRGTLATIARDHGLTAEHVSLRPIVENEDTHTWPRYVWYDQLIKPRHPEEIFPRPDWGQFKDHTSEGQQKAWSQVVGFWNKPGYSMMLYLTTRVENDERRWFLVVDYSSADVHIVYRGGV